MVEGKLTLPKMDGVEISPNIFLIGEPSPRPDIADTAFVCLANVHGQLGLVQLKVKLKGDGKCGHHALA